MFPAAPLDRGTRWLTFASAVFLCLILAWSAGAPGGVWGTVFTLVMGLAIFVGGWGFAPSSYGLGGGALHVRRQLFGGRTFTLTGDVVRAPKRFGLGGIRLMGSGGFFGWYGTFWRAGSGRYLAYVTDRSGLVACTTDHGIVLVSPVDPDAFVRAARSVRR